MTDKFALGGRWLRGFDNYGAGPRNSRSSYVGGNNIAVTKFDYSYEITNKSNFSIYLNIFNDYGIIWENKTKPKHNDNNLRASAGFGIKYYSPVGPIGFTWGFPLIDEDYDIKRMFLFSIEYRLKLIYFTTIIFLNFYCKSIYAQTIAVINIQSLIDNHVEYYNAIKESSWFNKDILKILKIEKMN